MIHQRIPSLWLKCTPDVSNIVTIKYLYYFGIVKISNIIIIYHGHSGCIRCAKQILRYNYVYENCITNNTSRQSPTVIISNMTKQLKIITIF